MRQWLAARQAPLRGLVLAGGLSQRMQADKGRLRYGSTGAISGDVIAYGTAVTLEPPRPVAAAAEARAAGKG